MVKDFTTEQDSEGNSSQQAKIGALKCTVCNVIVRAFGVKVGALCRAPGLATTETDLGSSQPVIGACTGVMIKVNDKTADNMKRQSDDRR
jgi:hypothetical protein